MTAAAIDNTTSGIYLLDRGNRQIDFYTSRLATGSPAPASSFSISAQTSDPTGLAVSNRTGNIMVIDSNTYNSGGQTYANLEVYSSAGSHLKTIPIMVSKQASGSNLSVSAAGETNFKILFDEQKNILFLTAPNTGSGYIFALSMPDYL